MASSNIKAVTARGSGTIAWVEQSVDWPEAAGKTVSSLKQPCHCQPALADVATGTVTVTITPNLAGGWCWIYRDNDRPVDLTAYGEASTQAQAMLDAGAYLRQVATGKSTKGVDHEQ